MKRLWLVLLIAVSVPLCLEGKEVTPGTYSGYNLPDESPCPYGNYTAFERDQYLFTAAEIIAAGGSAGEIMALSFYVESVNGCQPLYRFAISMGQTTLSEFGSDFVEGLTNLMQTNPYQPVQGWNRHSFATPFVWDGASNLVVQAGYRVMNTTSANPGVNYGITGTYIRTLYENETTIGANQSTRRPIVKFTMNPVSLPYAQSFDSGSFPAGWSQARNSNEPSTDWVIGTTNHAGGTPNEAKWTGSPAAYSRLVSPLIKLDGASSLQVSFRHGYIPYADQPGVSACLQYSFDLYTWYPASWSHESAEGYATGMVYGLITNPQHPYLYLGWAVCNPGSLHYCDYWFIDDVGVAPAPVHDVWARDIAGVKEVVNLSEAVTPKARVANVGASAENVLLQMEYGDGEYSESVQVSNLAPGEERIISFPSFTPFPGYTDPLTFQAVLAGDQNSQNNETGHIIHSLKLNQQAYAYAYNDNSGYRKFTTFTLAHPESVAELTQAPLNERTLTCGEWIAGEWYAAEYDLPWDIDTDRIWRIDTVTGAAVEAGRTGLEYIVGMAYDPVSSTLYGATNSSLYRLNRLTGIPTLIESLGISIALHGIAYDYRNAILYAVGGEDASDPCLYRLNTSNGNATLIGHLGRWSNVPGTYSDCAFDQDNGNLYLCTSSGYWNRNLFYIDTNDGSAWSVGCFPQNPDVYSQPHYTGFAIPYTYLAKPDVTIAPDGTLSWPAVPGADIYHIYTADKPEGPFTFTVTTIPPVWFDSFSSMHDIRFYQVRAVKY